MHVPYYVTYECGGAGKINQLFRICDFYLPANIVVNSCIKQFHVLLEADCIYMYTKCSYC